MIRFILLSFVFTLSLFSLNGSEPQALSQYTVAEELHQEQIKNEYYQLGSNQVESQIIEITDPNDPRIGKVKEQKIWIQPDKDPIVFATYLYQNGETEVIDGKGNRTVYRFQKDRISEIETESGKKQFSWMEEKPFIQEYTLHDKSGHQIKSILYDYDDEGKLVQETATGDFSGEGDETYNRFRTYNEDGSVAVMWDDQGFYVEYSYDPITKLVTSTDTPNTQAKHRYNEEGNLTSVRVLEKETGEMQEVFVTTPPYYAQNNSQQYTSNQAPSFLSFNTLWRCINGAARYLNRQVNDELVHCAETHQIVDTAYHFADSIGCELLEPYYVDFDYMKFAGFHSHESETGIYGDGFEHKKYRITFVNGILTTMDDLRVNMQLISEAHDGCNIHYCYVGTRGWTNDLVRSSFCKMGVTTPEAKELARIWRELIQDMGGPDNGGIIFHYAHSLGGTETHLAKFLLNPEELKMIRVITFGSPTLIPNEGFHSVTNLISCRDVISALDPIGFVSALVFETNSFFVGSHWDGYPIVDHPFYSYWTYLQAHFWEEVEELLDELK